MTTTQELEARLAEAEATIQLEAAKAKPAALPADLKYPDTSNMHPGQASVARHAYEQRVAEHLEKAPTVAPSPTISTPTFNHHEGHRAELLEARKSLGTNASHEALHAFELGLSTALEGRARGADVPAFLEKIGKPLGEAEKAEYYRCAKICNAELTAARAEASGAPIHVTSIADIPAAKMHGYSLPALPPGVELEVNGTTAKLALAREHNLPQAVVDDFFRQELANAGVT